MLKISKMGIIFLIIALTSMLLLTACGDDDTKEPTPTETPTTIPTETTEPTEEPTPSPTGPTCVYQVTYEDEVTNWTFNMTGEETIDGVACYVVEASFDVEPFRYANPSGAPTKVTGISYAISKDTLDVKQAQAKVEVMGNALTSIQTSTYTGDHGQPFAFGDAYAISQHTELVPPMYEPYTLPINIEVTAIEDVTVPAGTFRCYKVENTMQGNPLDTEWYSAEYDLMMPVKVVRYAQYQAIETRELVSYDPMPEMNTVVPNPTSKPVETDEPTPSPTDEPTPTPTEEPTPSPTDEPTPTPTDEPTPPPASGAPAVGTTWTYEVDYDCDAIIGQAGNPITEQNVTTWTMTVTGEETVNGVDCYVAEGTIEGAAKRQYTYPGGMMPATEVPVNLNGLTVYRSIENHQLISEAFSLYANVMGGIPVDVARVYDQSATPATLSEDSAWTYGSVVDLAAFLFNEEMTWDAEVVGTEVLSVGGEDVTCYKIEAHGTGGALPDATNIYYWDVDGKYPCPVKYVYNYIFLGSQTAMLTSYNPA